VPFQLRFKIILGAVVEMVGWLGSAPLNLVAWLGRLGLGLKRSAGRFFWSSSAEGKPIYSRDDGDDDVDDNVLLVVLLVRTKNNLHCHHQGSLVTVSCLHTHYHSTYPHPSSPEQRAPLLLDSTVVAQQVTSKVASLSFPDDQYSINTSHHYEAARKSKIMYDQTGSCKAVS
jgi:hypothetical protein